MKLFYVTKFIVNFIKLGLKIIMKKKLIKDRSYFRIFIYTGPNKKNQTTSFP